MKKLIVVIFLLSISISTKCQNVFGFQYKTTEAKQVIVTDVYKNSPAEKCGLKMGDYLSFINDTPLANLTLDEVQKIFTNSPVTNNKLKYTRDNKQLICTINKEPLESFEFSCLSGNCNNGECELQSVLGYTIKGNCKNGSINGQAKFYVDNKLVFSGMVVNNIRNGQGTRYLETGKMESNFENGKAVGKGKYTLNDSSYIVGNLVNGAFEGDADWYNPYHEVYKKLVYKNGKVEKSTEVNTTAETQHSSGDYEQSLAELNAFIQSAFDKTFEVKDKKIINYFKGGKAEANITDLYKVVKLPKYNYVYLICKDDNKCVYSSYTQYNHPEFTFQCENEANMDKTFDLLSRFWFELTGTDSRIKFTNSELLNIQNIENREVVLLDVDKSEPAYSSLKKMLNKTVKASYLFMNYDFESYNGRIIIDDKNSYTVKKIKVALASSEIVEHTQDKGTSIDSDKYKSNIEVLNNNTVQKTNEKVNDGVAEFKSGDRVVIEIGLLDNHFVENGKSKYDGETGVVVELEFDDVFGTYWGKIKMDSDKKVVEFNDIGIKSVTQTNNSVQQNISDNDNYIVISEKEFVVREYKKGDKVLIQINSMDDHFRMRGKSPYNGETGIVVELEYDDLDNSYSGKIKMDSDKKVVEFNDIWVKLLR